MKILSVIGTRPEAIKMAPVLHELARHPDRLQSLVCLTAQHRQMLDQMLNLLDITADFDLDTMQPDQTLSTLTSRLLEKLDPIFDRVQPDWILVQGDTTSVMAASLAAYYRQIKVGHVEAGLRTYDKNSPYPEEVNRRIVGSIADLHFCPSARARELLLAEGVRAQNIKVTGNTVIDALLQMRERVKTAKPALPRGLCEAMAGRRMILVTGHRRENFDGGLENICLALRDIAAQNPDVLICYAVHLNPRVRETVYRILSGTEGIMLIEPQPYDAFIWLMDNAFMILTDSGGVQEEAPTLGKPVLVLRDVTERPEGVDAGNASIVGTSRDTIRTHTQALLDNEALYRRMTAQTNPYGDGTAAFKIVQALLNYPE